MSNWDRITSLNESVIDLLERELPQSSIGWLFLSIIASILWIVYLTYYNSRVIGVIVSKISNKFLSKGYIKFGKFISFLYSLETYNSFL